MLQKHTYKRKTLIKATPIASWLKKSLSIKVEKWPNTKGIVFTLFYSRLLYKNLQKQCRYKNTKKIPL